MNARILLVDDEPRVLDAIKRKLSGHPFDITTAAGAEEALALLEAGAAFAVIVSDLRMPGMDGMQLLSRVAECAPETTRIILSGAAELRSAMLAAREGEVFRFLTKPCPVDELVSTISAGADLHRDAVARQAQLAAEADEQARPGAQ